MAKDDKRLGYEFPFLVGRIRATHMLVSNIIILALFPFLVGRIRALIQKALSFWLKLFPFLVGRIRASMQLFLNKSLVDFHSL